MKKRKKTKTDIDRSLQKWSEISEEEKAAIINSARPALQKWFNIPLKKRKLISYSCLLAVLILSSTMALSGVFAVRVFALLLFLTVWPTFLFLEKCSKQGIDVLLGVLLYGHFTETEELRDSSASNTTAK